MNEKEIGLVKEKSLDSKTFVYIDAANIILAMKNLNHDVDFKSIFIYLSDRFRTKDIFYFSANFEFINMEELNSAGYKIVSKQVYYQNKVKVNCDVEIAHEITKDIDFNICNSIVLLSGDGDFSVILDYANQNNKKVNVISVHKNNTAKLLRKKKYFKVEYISEMKDPHGNLIHGERLSI